MKPNRPHHFQTSNSTFAVQRWGEGFIVVEHWFGIDRHGEDTDHERIASVHATREAATEALEKLMEPVSPCP